jgi:hypothetical protein
MKRRHLSPNRIETQKLSPDPREILYQKYREMMQDQANKKERRKLTCDLVQILHQRQLELKRERLELLLTLKEEVIKISSDMVVEEKLENTSPDFRNGFSAGYQHRCDELAAYKKARDEYNIHIGF